MIPTPEQLEAVEAAIRDVPFHERSRTAFDVIAPLVLEAAAKECEWWDHDAPRGYPHHGWRDGDECAARIRALKDAK